jgi:hypothetical protein
LIVGALAMLSSVQFICFGIMAEMMSRVYFESTAKATYVTRQVHSNERSQTAPTDREPFTDPVNRMAG